MAHTKADAGQITVTVLFNKPARALLFSRFQRPPVPVNRLFQKVGVKKHGAQVAAGFRPGRIVAETGKQRFICPLHIAQVPSAGRQQPAGVDPVFQKPLFLCKESFKRP